MEAITGCISGGAGDVEGLNYCYDPTCNETSVVEEYCALDCPTFTGDRYKMTYDNYNCTCMFGMSLNETDGYCWRDCSDV
jgi:hypothetical protein